MNLFINDIPVRIFKDGVMPDLGLYNYIVDASVEPLVPVRLSNSVLIKKANSDDLDRVITLITDNKLKSLTNMAITVDDYIWTKKYVKSKFKIIKAAGGLVMKGDKTLMIYRLKKWDLPKGKLEKGEETKAGALREVEEECNVKVKMGKKICTTWHTYTMNKNSILKKTSWYTMKLLEDDNMKPQLEEDIEQVRWMNPKEVYHALKDSYQSISYVFDKYQEKTGLDK